MPNSRESARGTEPRATLEEKATPQSASLTAFLNSQWSLRCAHKFACGSPLLIGLTSRCFAHSARASCAPLVPRGAFWAVLYLYEVAPSEYTPFKGLIAFVAPPASFSEERFASTQNFGKIGACLLAEKPLQYSVE